MNMKWLTIWLISMLGLLGASLWYLFSPGTVPDGQAQLVTLGTGNLQQFQSEFNQHVDKIRVVALLSPTGMKCLQGASAIEQVLGENDKLQLHGMVVWETVLDSDWAPPSTGTLGRIFDL